MATVSMDLVNPAIADAIIYTGVSASLEVTLKNLTGAAITMSKSSVLEIYMPYYFTQAEVEAMSITRTGWIFSYNSIDNSLMLTWGEDSGTWADTDSVSFTISSVLCASDPSSDTVQINFSGFSGSSIPSQDSVTLLLNEQPVQQDASLTDVLDVSIDSNATVYVSTSDNPLTNSLYLNFKNIGTDPLYKGDSFWSGNPKVAVSFVYGSTSGSLAPDDKDNTSETGSAWSIDAAVYVDQTDGWSVQNPSVTSGTNSPVWEFTPNKTNQEIIGTGDKSNVTFVFSNIISLTPVGATQMYIQFSGFSQDENTTYNDGVFVLNISKQNPPSSGAIGIWTTSDDITVSRSTDEIKVPLTWSMFDVAAVKLSFDVPNVPIEDRTYTYADAHDALNYDSDDITFSGLEKSEMMLVTCSAYSDTNFTKLLNKVQCTIPLNFPAVIYSFTITSLATSPPYSYLFQLDWDIGGATSFEITADSGDGPVNLNVPQNVETVKVSPTAPQTVYTLNVYSDELSDE